MKTRAQHRPTSRRFRPQLEALEDRWMPSTLTVTSPGDGSFRGTLRYEIAAAHSGDTVVFAPTVSTINLGASEGELYIYKSLTIQGPGADKLTISAAGSRSRVFEVNSGRVTLYGMTISGGNGVANTSGDPWGPPPATQYEGGGILNDLNGYLTISGCTISKNTADYGGGIANFGTLTVSQSTISDNSAWSLLVPTPHANGGGIYTQGRTTTLTNCTIANNQAQYGGGLFVGHSNATLTNCTLSGNSGGIYNQGGLNLTNTIVAGNTPGGVWQDIHGVVATADHNLVGDATGSTGIVNGVNGNIVGGNGNPVIDPLLGPLQNNGGPTQTMALLAGSPAIGHADNTVAPALDQRGIMRMDLAGEMTDIGAFEL